jgi:hypothetical protein
LVTLTLKKLLPSSIYFINNDLEMIKIARKEAEKNNLEIEFIVDDCSQIKSYGEFDIQNDKKETEELNFKKGGGEEKEIKSKKKKKGN